MNAGSDSILPYSLTILRLLKTDRNQSKLIYKVRYYVRNMVKIRAFILISIEEFT